MENQFNKQTSCLAGPYDEIEPGVTEKLDYEVQLDVIIGAPAKHVAEANAPQYVFGYVVANDISARDWQFHSPTFTVGKSFDTHGPIGLIFSVGQQIAHLSTAFTLDSGDLIAAISPGIGFHHASFEVANPDEVGRGGRALVARAQRGNWGFGRHTIGSNFFHYIQDPWGSWLEYYSDMDHIDEYKLGSPTNYDIGDSLASWGSAVPQDIVHNYEADDEASYPP